MKLDYIDYDIPIGTIPTLTGGDLKGYTSLTPAPVVPFSWEYGSNPPCKCGYTGGHYRTTHLARMWLLRYGWERRSSF